MPLKYHKAKQRNKFNIPKTQIKMKTPAELGIETYCIIYRPIIISKSKIIITQSQRSVFTEIHHCHPIRQESVNTKNALAPKNKKIQGPHNAYNSKQHLNPCFSQQQMKKSLARVYKYAQIYWKLPMQMNLCRERSIAVKQQRGMEHDEPIRFMAKITSKMGTFFNNVSRMCVEQLANHKRKNLKFQDEHHNDAVDLDERLDAGLKMGMEDQIPISRTEEQKAKINQSHQKFEKINSEEKQIRKHKVRPQGPESYGNKRSDLEDKKQMKMEKTQVKKNQGFSLFYNEIRPQLIKDLKTDDESYLLKWGKFKWDSMPTDKRREFEVRSQLNESKKELKRSLEAQAQRNNESHKNIDSQKGIKQAIKKLNESNSQDKEYKNGLHKYMPSFDEEDREQTPRFPQ